MFENLDKLQDLEDRYLDLEAKISDPDVISNQAEWQRYTKAHAKLTEIVTVYREYKKLADTYQEDEAIVKAKEDPELAAMAEEELKELKPEIEVYEEKLTILLLPKDPNDEKNIIMEIRAGAGAQPCLPGTGSGCTPATPKTKAGRWNSWTPAPRAWGASRKWYSWCPARTCTAI